MVWQGGQLSLAVHLPDDETFSSYIGEENKSIVAHLKAFIEDDANALLTTVPPTGFYLFGGNGVGKSHLLHASCAFADQAKKTSVCLSFNELTKLSVELFEGLEHIDLVCLDGIHLIAGNKPWQRAVFDLYNRMTENSKQLIITGNESVKKLKITLPDLRSRISWGFVEQVKPLTDEEKITALQYKAKQRGLVLQKDAIKYLFTHLSRNMSNLVESLDILDKASIREQRKITIPFIKSILFS